jgi:hypothetical protein
MMRITINLDKAKDITKDRLRAERAPLLQSLDVQFQRALETGENTAEIVAEKQRLRDITQLADAATTPDELKQISTE